MSMKGGDQRLRESGMLRLTYSYEAHSDVFLDSDTDSDGGDAQDGDSYHPGSSALSGAFNTSITATKSQRKDQHLLCSMQSVNATRLKAVHTLTSNSPFLTVKCGDFRAVTKTQYLSGSVGSWLGLNYSFPLDVEAKLVVTVYSSQSLIGSAAYSQADLLSAPRDNFGCVLLSSPIFSDQGEDTGELTAKIAIGADSTDGGEALGPGEGLVGREVVPLSLPFTLRIHSVVCLDILLGVTEEFFYKNTMLLGVTHETWNKQTIACEQDIRRKAMAAEWRDSDWLFVVTDGEGSFRLDVMVNGVLLGTMFMSVSDLFRHPSQTDGRIELSGYVVTDQPVGGGEIDKQFVAGPQRSIGKLKLVMSVAPYVTPEEKLALNRISGSRSGTPAILAPVLICKIRIKHIAVRQLLQVYGLFRNSPRVAVLIYDLRVTHVAPSRSKQLRINATDAGQSTNDYRGGSASKASTPNNRSTSFSSATSIAVDAGSDFTWGALSWGLIPVYSGHTVLIKVTSGNESLGEVRMTSEALLARLQSVPGAVTPSVRVMLKDGSVERGEVEMGCLLIVDAECKGGGGGRGGGSAVGTLFDTETSFVTADANSQLALPPLSLSTPTPRSTQVFILGLSVFDLQDVGGTGGGVFRLSPQVRLACNTWRVETNIAQFAGPSANWLVKRADLWQFSMKHMTFLRVHVHSGSTLLGSVYISTRELMEVEPSAQGVCIITRPLERDLAPSGKVQISFALRTEEAAGLNINNLSAHNVAQDRNKQQWDTPGEKLVVSPSHDGPAFPTISSTVLHNVADARSTFKTHQPTHIVPHVPDLDLQGGNLVLNNAPLVRALPLDVAILEMTCLDVVDLHVLTRNSLQVEVLLNDVHKSTNGSNNINKMRNGKANTKSRASADETDGEVPSVSGTRMLTSVAQTSSGAHAGWENLNYRFPVLDPRTTITFSVLSQGKRAGSLVVTATDLLNTPRTAQGFTEITRNILGASSRQIIGKLHLCLLMAPHLSEQQIATFTARVARDPVTKGNLHTLSRLGTLDLYLVSCTDISLIFRLLYCTVAIGPYMNLTDPVVNQRGTCIISNLDPQRWHNIILYERSHLLLTLHGELSVVGSMLVSVSDILAVPVDKDGFVVVYGSLLSGLVVKGGASIACKIHRAQGGLFGGGAAGGFNTSITDVQEATVPVIPSTDSSPAALITNNGSLVLHNTHSLTHSLLPLVGAVSTRYDRSAVQITSIAASSLRAIHKVGKNSPLVRMETRGFKFTSPSLSYAGSSALWRDLMWPLELSQPAKVKLTVLSSGSVVIGIATITIEDVLEELARQDADSFQAQLGPFKILKAGECNGEVTLNLQFREEVAPVANSSNHLNVLQRPEHASQEYSDSLFQIGGVEGESTILVLHDTSPADAFTAGVVAEYARQTDSDLADNQSIFSGTPGESLVGSGGSQQSIYDDSHAGEEGDEVSGSTQYDSRFTRSSAPYSSELDSSTMLTDRTDVSGASGSRPKTSVGLETITIASGSANGHSSSEGCASQSLSQQQQLLSSSESQQSRLDYSSSGVRSTDESSSALSPSGSTTLFSPSRSTVSQTRSLFVSESDSPSAESQSLYTAISGSLASSSHFGTDTYYTTRSSPGDSSSSRYADSRHSGGASRSMASSHRTGSSDDSQSSTFSESQSQSLLTNTLFNSSSAGGLHGGPSLLSVMSGEEDDDESLVELQKDKLRVDDLLSVDTSSVRDVMSFYSDRAGDDQGSLHTDLRLKEMNVVDGETRLPLTGRSESSAFSAYSQFSDYSQYSSDNSARSGNSSSRSDFDSPRSQYSEGDGGGWDDEDDLGTARNTDRNRIVGDEHGDYSLPPAQMRNDNKLSRNAPSTGDYYRSTAPQPPSHVAPRLFSQDLLYFDLTPLRFSLPPSMTLRGVARVTACELVRYVTSSVVDSFVAMYTGGNYSLRADPGSSSTSTLLDEHCPLSDADLLRYLACRAVRTYVSVGGTNILRFKVHQMESAVLDRQFGIDVVSVSSGGSSETRDVPKFMQTNNKNQLMMGGQFRKRVGITMTAGGEKGPGDELKEFSTAPENDDQDPPSDPDEIELVTGFDRTQLREDFFAKGDPQQSALFKYAPIHSIPAAIPMRAKVSILELLGLDIGFMDPRVLPKRPYLTACKPYGNWAGETGPLWTDIDCLQKSDLVLNFLGLDSTWRWETFLLRMGQSLVFDLHDGGSGLVFAKSRLTYEELMCRTKRPLREGFPESDNKGQLQYEVTTYLQFIVANEYGGGSFGGVVRMFLDLSVNIYVRPKKSTEYWDRHRIHHWKNFPLTPINTGVVRQKYREIAEEYDQQMVVHPVFYGFKVRFTGNPEDESRFIHPMFIGFSLAKKPLMNKGQQGRTGLTRGVPNPWRYDPTAAQLGKCPICADGVAGCPRCFMLPIHEKTGEMATLQEFEYDPLLEEQQERERRQAEIEVLAKERRKNNHKDMLLLDDSTVQTVTATSSSSEAPGEQHTKSSVFVEHTTDEAGRQFVNGKMVDEKMSIHTNLTTYRALRNYRNVHQKLLTVFVKVMPTGYIRKVLVDAQDSVWHLYNMFNSHSNLGNSHSSMMLLPMRNGLFELHREIVEESDLLRGDYRGRDALRHFGFTQRSSSVVLLYFAHYNPLYVGSLLWNFFADNTDFQLQKLQVFEDRPDLEPGRLPVHDSLEHLQFSDEKREVKLLRDMLPWEQFEFSRSLKPVCEDDVQQRLLTLIAKEYDLQQRRELARLAALGREHLTSSHATSEAELQRLRDHEKEREKERIALNLRFESQLKGMTPKERRRAMKALVKRESLKKRSVLSGRDKEEFIRQNTPLRLTDRVGKPDQSTETDDGSGGGVTERSELSMNDIDLSEASLASTNTSTVDSCDTSDTSSSSDSSDSESSDLSSGGESDSGSDEAPPIDADGRVRRMSKLADIAKVKEVVLKNTPLENATPPVPRLFYVIDAAPLSFDNSSRSSVDNWHSSTSSGTHHTDATHSQRNESHQSRSRRSSHSSYDYSMESSRYSSSGKGSSVYSDSRMSFATDDSSGTFHTRDTADSSAASISTFDSRRNRSTVTDSTDESQTWASQANENGSYFVENIQTNERFAGPTGSIYSTKLLSANARRSQEFPSGVRSVATIFSNETPTMESESVLSSGRSGYSDSTYSASGSLESQMGGRSVDSLSTGGGLFTYRSAFSLNSLGTVDSTSTAGGSYFGGIYSSQSSTSFASGSTSLSYISHGNPDYSYSTTGSVSTGDLSSRSKSTNISFTNQNDNVASRSVTNTDSDSWSGTVDSSQLLPPQLSTSIFSNRTKTVSVPGYGYLDQDAASTSSGYRSKMYSLVESSRESGQFAEDDSQQTERSKTKKKKAYKSPVASIRSDTSERPPLSNAHSCPSQIPIGSHDVKDDWMPRVSVVQQFQYTDTGRESLLSDASDLYMSSNSSPSSLERGPWFDEGLGGVGVGGVGDDDRDSGVYSRGSSAKSNISSDWSYLSVGSRESRSFQSDQSGDDLETDGSFYSADTASLNTNMGQHSVRDSDCHSSASSFDALDYSLDSGAYNRHREEDDDSVSGQSMDYSLSYTSRTTYSASDISSAQGSVYSNSSLAYRKYLVEKHPGKIQR